MKYEKLIFIYPFSIGSFLNAKIGMEATLEEGDDVNECFDKLSKDVKLLAFKEQGNVAPEWAKDYHEVTTDSLLPQGTFTIQHNQKEPEERRIGDIVSDIKSCTEIPILETYRILAKTKPEFQTAYDEQMELLTSKKEEAK